MNIENEIFKRTKVKVNTLIPYGFTKKKNVYEYKKEFSNSFRADIIVDEKGVVTGKVYDLDMEDEYTSFRIENQVGGFTSLVREEYQNILKDIKNNCFESLYFVTPQASRIANKIIEVYHDEPEFLWDKFPGYGVFRNKENDKWYGALMNIDKSKIDPLSKGEIEVINLKVEEEKIQDLLKKKGFYPSYHMNKKNWITITLDDTLKDEEILKYVTISHKYTERTNEWIVPANPKYYDVITAFQRNNIIEWKQSSNIKEKDIIYLYVGSPYSAILYKCEAIEVNIPYEYKDKNLSMKKVMKIKLLEEYSRDQYPFSKLKEYGVNAIRGPRSMPDELKNEMNKNS